ncbi:hypothetical protein BY458DRAFT_516605 [Sporodiniella umbellata]|nr:hypothetical protein BY458DRAFT_516605 [Sporodiniella umbellata]
MANHENNVLGVISADDDGESDYSLDYEYIGPREPNYRGDQDADSDCSELSDSSCHNGFDMWDEDPYSTNDFTWESNDMKLTSFVKKRKKVLDTTAFWSKSSSFYKKGKGWPLQLPYSCTTTNHDQSAASLCLVLSDYGISEKLLAIYRDRIISCGNPSNRAGKVDHHHKQKLQSTTWLESEQDILNTETHCKSNSSLTHSSLFCETHASVSLAPTTQSTMHSKEDPVDTLNFLPYTKYLKRAQFPITLSKDAYLPLSFEALCLAEKYGYMAVGGIEGEFEVYCCMDREPTKIWGTKFKGKNNVMLMTNAIQIVRVTHRDNYRYLLIACMNDAGVLVYELPKHPDSHSSVSLLQHIRSFDRVPINDAKLSPDGQQLVCVGDDACLFRLTLIHTDKQLSFTSPKKTVIPYDILCNPSSPFSSQHISWSKSSLYFAHTSDTHNFVLVWRTYPTLEILYRIDSAGYTYAVEFHPEYEGILAFTNRYGYLHTVDLTQAISIYNPEKTVSVDQLLHTCNPSCLSHSSESVYHTLDLVARQEITMVSFRGEENKKLRILAKINGIQWSKDGKYIYVSTKKRVLAYRFMKSFSRVDTLEKITSQSALATIEKHSRKRKRRSSFQTEKRLQWEQKWNQLPEFLRQKITANCHNLASH